MECIEGMNEHFRVRELSGNPQAFTVLWSCFKGNYQVLWGQYQLLWKSEVAVRGDRQDGVLDEGRWTL